VCTLFWTTSSSPGHWSHTQKKKRNEKKNYAGSKTLPASMKEKETHLPQVP
jgi:hypothetical protein